MKTRLIYIVTAALLLAMGAGTAWSQATSGKIKGTITEGGKPLANAQVVLTSLGTGKTYKMKTDKDGSFSGVGITFGDYEEEIISEAGDKLFKKQARVMGEGGAVDDLSIEVSGGTAGGQPKVTKEQIEKIKAENAKATNMNALINLYNTAKAAQNWADAETALTQMVTVEPRWEFYQALGGIQMNLKKYQESVDSYEKGIQIAQEAAAGKAAGGGSAPDPAKAKAGIGQMLGAEGNSYLKLNKQPEAIAALTKSAEMDPNPGTAFFNLCAIQYNTGNMQAAGAACDKAIAADPAKADAYFIKGSVLIGMSDGKLDPSGHLIVPVGTKEALNKYLELAPEGGHASDVKAMLEGIGAKMETSFKDKGGKKK